MPNVLLRRATETLVRDSTVLTPPPPALTTSKAWGGLLLAGGCQHVQVLHNEFHDGMDHGVPRRSVHYVDFVSSNYADSFNVGTHSVIEGGITDVGLTGWIADPATPPGGGADLETEPDAELLDAVFDGEFECMNRLLFNVRAVLGDERLNVYDALLSQASKLAKIDADAALKKRIERQKYRSSWCTTPTHWSILDTRGTSAGRTPREDVVSQLLSLAEPERPGRGVRRVWKRSGVPARPHTRHDYGEGSSDTCHLTGFPRHVT